MVGVSVQTGVPESGQNDNIYIIWVGNRDSGENERMLNGLQGKCLCPP